MVFPSGPSDFFEAADQFLGGAAAQAGGSSFGANPIPTYSPLGTRNAKLPDFRLATHNRKMMHWLVPEGTIVQMYVNPQNVTYTSRKSTTEQRTKGGFVLQYWGEELGTISIGGTTGTSGIEGIQVLEDIYRNEQLAFDPYALTIAAKLDAENYSAGVFGDGAAGSFVSNIASGGDLLSSALNAATGVTPSTSFKAPSLAYLAFTVELFWSGVVYRGFFKDFIVTESADKLGLFDYSMNFVYTQKRGYRQNFMPWHRTPTAGPSMNISPLVGNVPFAYGRPHSFGGLIDVPASSPSVETKGINGPFENMRSGIANSARGVADAGEDFYNSIVG